MSTLSRGSWITLPTFIMKEQNPDLFSYKTFSTVTLSFLTRPGEVSHQASWWSLSLSLQVFPSTWPSPSHSLLVPRLCPFPPLHLPVQQGSRPQSALLFSFHCDIVLGTDFQIRGAFFSCHISEVGTKNPVSPSAGTPDLLTTFKLRWAASDLELPGPLSS